MLHNIYGNLCFTDMMVSLEIFGKRVLRRIFELKGKRKETGERYLMECLTSRIFK